jgi:hypothetical protein
MGWEDLDVVDPDADAVQKGGAKKADEGHHTQVSSPVI